MDKARRRAKFDISWILSQAMGAIGANPLVYLALSLMVAGPPAFVAGWWQFDVRDAAIAEYPKVPIAYYLHSDFWFHALGIWGIGLVFGGVLRASLTRATVIHLSGDKPSLVRCLEAGLSLVFPMIALSLIVWIGVAIGFVLLVVPGVILWLCWSMAIPARVQERIGVADALRRSAALTSGNRGNIFLIILVTTIGLAVLGSIARMLLSPIASSQPMSALTETVVGALSAMVTITVEASIYVELRNLKDGAPPSELESIFA